MWEWSCLLMLSRFSHVWLSETLWTVARHAPLSLGFSRQEYWSGLPCPPPGIFLTQELNQHLYHLLQWQAFFFSTSIATWSGGGFPSGSDGKESACIVGNLGLIPGLGRCPEGEHGNPLQYSCLKDPHGQRSLACYSPWSHKELDRTKGLSTAQCHLGSPRMVLGYS